MKKDVRIIIKGLHNAGDDESDIVTEVVGIYYNKNGKHYVCYEETEVSSGELHKSVIIMQEVKIELIRRGSGATHLIFEKGKINNTYYQTDMGRLSIGVNTKSIELIEKTDEIDASIEYSLLMDEQVVSECVVEIKIAAT